MRSAPRRQAARRAGHRDRPHRRGRRAAAFPRPRRQADEIRARLLQPFLKAPAALKCRRTGTRTVHARHHGRRGCAARLNRSPNFVKHQRCIRPSTICAAARSAALPHFAFEYGDGGAGADTGIKRNWAALDAVELVPRYGVMPSLPPVERRAVRPAIRRAARHRADGRPDRGVAGRRQLLAKAAQRARVPYTLGMVGGATIEEIAEIAPDVLWFQLYRFAKNDHAIGFDLVRRARGGRRRMC